LTTSNGLHSGKEPSDLAFLAMTQERLGMRNASRTTLQKLKVILGNSRAHDFLREAEALILDAPFPADPFAHID
jgi:hypothetical protein